MPNKWQDYRNTMYNYQTEQYEDPGKPLADFGDDDAMKYIPAIPAAHGLYEVYRLMDFSVMDAMEKTLRACIGDHS